MSMEFVGDLENNSSYTTKHDESRKQTVSVEKRVTNLIKCCIQLTEATKYNCETWRISLLAVAMMRLTA